MMQRLLGPRMPIFAAIVVQTVLVMAAGASLVSCFGAIVLAGGAAILGLRIDPERKLPALLLAAGSLVFILLAWFTPGPAGLTLFDMLVLKGVTSLLAIESACLLLTSKRDQPHELMYPLITAGIAGAFYVYADPIESAFVPSLALAFAAVVAWIAYSLLGHSFSDKRNKQTTHAANSGSLLLWRIGVPLAMVALISATMQFAVAYTTEGVRGAQQLVNSQLQGGRVMIRRRTKQFVHGGTLSSVLDSQQSDPAGVALRVFSRNRPGYLRGNVFDSFENSKWRRRTSSLFFQNTNFLKPLTTHPAGVPETPMEHRLFALRDPGGITHWRTVKVVNDPRRLPVYFTPLDARLIEGWGQSVGCDANLVVRTGLWVARPYTIHSPVIPPREPLAEDDRIIALEPLTGLEPAALRIGKEITQGKTTTAARIQAVVEYFNREFQYSLEGFKAPTGRDPVSYFLLTKQPSHCEFFATAAVAFLRQAGVPCRYVTGYRVTELEEGHTEFWIGRNRDAHAWVEAYDAEAGRWVTVEPTPGMELEEEIDLAARVAADAEFNKSTAERATGLLTRLVRAIMSGPAGLSTAAFLIVSVSGIIWFTTTKRFVMRRLWESKDAFARRQRAALLESMDRKVRKSGYLRQRSETLHQFAQRIEDASADNQRLSDACDWYRKYAAHRYGAPGLQAPPLPE